MLWSHILWKGISFTINILRHYLAGPSTLERTDGYVVPKLEALARYPQWSLRGAPKACCKHPCNWWRRFGVYKLLTYGPLIFLFFDPNMNSFSFTLSIHINNYTWTEKNGMHLKNIVWPWFREYFCHLVFFH